MFPYCTNQNDPDYTADSHFSLCCSYPAVKVSTLVAAESHEQVRTKGITETFGTYHFFHFTSVWWLRNRRQIVYVGRTQRWSNNISILTQVLVDHCTWGQFKECKLRGKRIWRPKICHFKKLLLWAVGTWLTANAGRGLLWTPQICQKTDSPKGTHGCEKSPPWEFH